MTHHDCFRLSRRSVFLLAGSVLLAACAQTSVVDSWKTGQPVVDKPSRVAVVAVLPEALLRESVEVDVARILADKGTPAVPSSRIPGMSGGIRGEIDTEAANRLLRAADVDGVVVMFYSGGGKSEAYERSDYWVEFLGSGLAYNWGRPYFTGFTDDYTVRESPGWEDYQTTVYIESSYYDLDTRMPVWRIVTLTKDLEHADAARDIANEAASEMRSAGLR